MTVEHHDPHGGKVSPPSDAVKKVRAHAALLSVSATIPLLYQNMKKI